MSTTLQSKYLGLLNYENALHLQKTHVEISRTTGKAFLLGLEHPSVVTLGVRGSAKDLKIPEVELQQRQIQVEKVDRGGEATLHSPGQLVIYPILPLKRWNLSVREFVQRLEQSAILFFRTFGVKAFKGNCEPGIYTNNGKIAFVGIRIDRGVSYHGMSLNISNDLSQFQFIRSCGKDQEKFDRLWQYDINASQMELFKTFEAHFLTQFIDFFTKEESTLTDNTLQV